MVHKPVKLNYFNILLTDHRSIADSHLTTTIIIAAPSICWVSKWFLHQDIQIVPNGIYWLSLVCPYLVLAPSSFHYSLGLHLRSSQWGRVDHLWFSWVYYHRISLIFDARENHVRWPANEYLYLERVTNTNHWFLFLLLWMANKIQSVSKQLNGTNFDTNNVQKLQNTYQP
jgi:hypothetical protein